MVGKSLLDAFSNLPTSAYNAIAIPNMAQVAFCLMMLTKLTLVEIPGWDLAHVRETLDLASYFEHFVSKLLHKSIIKLCFRPSVQLSA